MFREGGICITFRGEENIAYGNGFFPSECMIDKRDFGAEIPFVRVLVYCCGSMMTLVQFPSFRTCCFMKLRMSSLVMPCRMLS